MNTLLNRDTVSAGGTAPVRIVHMGLGAFHRAHQAWYTERVDADRHWGIAAFTGRSPRAAETLADQGGLYTLIERSSDGDRHQLIGSIVETHDGANLPRFRQLLSAESTAVVTITVTEAAYHVGPEGLLDAADEAVATDLKALRSLDDGGTPAVTTMAARLLVGLRARMDADAGPIAVVSCDNLAGNGAVARAAVAGMAEATDARLATWIDGNVSFVHTSVDRITPATTEADARSVATAVGYVDRAPVVTEPFSSWVLSGAFPAGRPPWENAGAVFVDDIEPFERRKLWLLNGAHSLLAYAGLQRGHDTVSAALEDPELADWVEQFWDEAQRHLPSEGLDIDEYRVALLRRFGNARIEHRLAQIATDGSSKLPMRAVPVMKAERMAGRTGEAGARMVAAWIDYLCDGGTAPDSASGALAAVIATDASDPTPGLVRMLDHDLADDAGAVALIASLRTGSHSAPDAAHTP